MNKPKRKRQPTAECYRDQLALAADEIISLRGTLYTAKWLGAQTADRKAHPWWRRIFRK